MYLSVMDRLNIWTDIRAMDFDVLWYSKQ